VKPVAHCGRAGHVAISYAAKKHLEAIRLGPRRRCQGSRAAFRKSQADTSHNVTKNPVRATIAPRQLAVAESNPTTSAITPTKTCASAVAAKTRAMPCGWIRTMRVPKIPTASTAPNNRLAGLSSDPMMPTGVR